MKERTPIDWNTVHARLEQDRAGIEEALSPGPGKVREAYRRRAARLARPVGRAEADGMPGDAVLIFLLGVERYGIELRFLKAIIAHPVCCPVPGAPPRVAGVLQVRGDIRPVWELTRILGLPDLPAGDPEVVLLVRKGAQEVGLRASRVETIKVLGPGERAGAPAGDGRRLTPDLVTLLDAEKILNEEA